MSNESGTSPLPYNDIATDLASLQAVLDDPVMEMCFSFPFISLMVPLVVIPGAGLVVLGGNSIARARFALLIALVGYLYLCPWIFITWQINIAMPSVMGLFQGLLCSMIVSLGIGLIYLVLAVVALSLYDRFHKVTPKPPKGIPFQFLKWLVMFAVVLGSMCLFAIMGWCNEGIYHFFASGPASVNLFLEPATYCVGVVSLWFAAIIFATDIGLLAGLHAVENEANFEWYKKLIQCTDGKKVSTDLSSEITGDSPVHA